MTSWSQTAVIVSLAVVFLGFCLYFTFNYLISWASSPYVIYGFQVAYLQSTMLSGMIPWFFWTALGFVITSVGVGLYMVSHRMITKGRWKSAVYIFGSAILIDILQNVAFIYLIGSVIPIMPGLGDFTQEATLFSFFVGTCLLPLFCFVLAGIGLGSYIGSLVDVET